MYIAFDKSFLSLAYNLLFQFVSNLNSNVIRLSTYFNTEN